MVFKRIELFINEKFFFNKNDPRAERFDPSKHVLFLSFMIHMNYWFEDNISQAFKTRYFSFDM